MELRKHITLQDQSSRLAACDKQILHDLVQFPFKRNSPNLFLVPIAFFYSTDLIIISGSLANWHNISNFSLCKLCQYRLFIFSFLFLNSLYIRRYNSLNVKHIFRFENIVDNLFLKYYLSFDALLKKSQLKFLKDYDLVGASSPFLSNSILFWFEILNKIFTGSLFFFPFWLLIAIYTFSIKYII